MKLHMNTKIVNKIHVQLLVYITFLLNTFSYNLLNFHRNISHKWNSGLHNTFGIIWEHIWFTEVHLPARQYT